MTRKNNTWTLAECLFHASTCNTKSNWYASHSTTYDFARRKGWKDYCATFLNDVLSMDECERLAALFIPTE